MPSVAATGHAPPVRPPIPLPAPTSFSASPAGVDGFPTARRPSESSFSSSVAMGQAESAVRSPQQPAHTQSSGAKVWFGWPGRRKKSEDFSKLMAEADVPFMTLPAASSTSTPSSTWSKKSKSKARENITRQGSSTSHSTSATTSSTTSEMHELSRPPSRSSARQLSQFASSKLTALKGRLNASQTSFHSHKTHGTPPITPPPPLPPKPDVARVSTSSSSSWVSSDSSRMSVDEQPAAPAPQPVSHAPSKEMQNHASPHVSGSTSITGVETRTHQVPTATPSPPSDTDVKQPARRERRDDDKSAKEIADDWRKSDSTLRTVRLVGSRTPRPLSLAESTNSGHTVHPGASTNTNLMAGKRLSALFTDAEFDLPEVDSEDDEDEAQERDTTLADKSIGSHAPPSAFASVRERVTKSGRSRSVSPSMGASSSRRGSLSIRINRRGRSTTRDETAPFDPASGSDSEVLSSSVSTGLTGLHTASSSTTSVTSSPFPKDETSSTRPSMDFIATTAGSETSLGDSRMHQYAQYNAKLDPWIGAKAATGSQTSLSTSASMSSNTGSNVGHKPSGLSSSVGPGPTLRPAHQRNRLQSIQARGFRQTAVNFTSKAVDRLGKSLALLGGTPGAEAAHSHSQVPPSPKKDSSSIKSEQLKKAGKGHRTLQAEVKKGSHPPVSSKIALRRHAQNQPSGTWSIGSASNSASDNDGPSTSSSKPNLGRCVRPSVPNARGLVFGRDLATCVMTTACDDAESREGPEIDVERDAVLERRLLPALVLRCAQHILKWGIQEEGLFRISGRSTHVSKLRSEFDAGGDYDLLECGPGEIDPHAVSSILKAYLRELPEPILTRGLTPYFEAALSAENSMIDSNASESLAQGHGLRSGPGLPSNPRSGVEQPQLRKAPSLSTFAVPTLKPRVASSSLINAVTSLIARLPRENRDLLRTVGELIAATADASAETKMPLSNLLLVFCPSMMMSPPLLRVFCEGKDIWNGPPEGVVFNVPEDLDRRSDGDEATGESWATDENTSSDPAKDANGGSAEERNEADDVHSEGAGDGHEAHDANGSVSMSKARGLTLSSLSLPLATAPSDSGSATSAGTPSNTYSPPGLSVSTDSLSLRTPSNTGCLPSHSASPITTLGSPNGPLVLETSSEPKAKPRLTPLRSQSDLPSPSGSNGRAAIRKSLIGHPVPFPLGLGMGHTASSAAGGSAPVTPIDHAMHFLRTHPDQRTSGYSSSSPDLQNSSFCFPPPVERITHTSPPSPGSSMGLRRRKSKASLLGLKAKQSISSLFGLTQFQSLEDAEKSEDYARSPVAEMTLEELGNFLPPPPRSITPCPVLNLPVDTSRMELGLGLDISEEPHDISPWSSLPHTPARVETPPITGGTLRLPMRRPSEDVLNRAASGQSETTASVYHTPPTTTRSLAPDNSLSTASSTSSGSRSFLDFNIGSGPEEDWANSVLLAATSSRDA